MQPSVKNSGAVAGHCCPPPAVGVISSFTSSSPGRQGGSRGPAGAEPLLSVSPAPGCWGRPPQWAEKGWVPLGRSWEGDCSRPVACSACSKWPHRTEPCSQPGTGPDSPSAASPPLLRPHSLLLPPPPRPHCPALSWGACHFRLCDSLWTGRRDAGCPRDRQGSLGVLSLNPGPSVGPDVPPPSGRLRVLQGKARDTREQH